MPVGDLCDDAGGLSLISSGGAKLFGCGAQIGPYSFVAAAKALNLAKRLHVPPNHVPIVARDHVDADRAAELVVIDALHEADVVDPAAVGVLQDDVAALGIIHGHRLAPSGEAVRHGAAGPLASGFLDHAVDEVGAPLAGVHDMAERLGRLALAEAEHTGGDADRVALPGEPATGRATDAIRSGQVGPADRSAAYAGHAMHADARRAVPGPPTVLRGVLQRPVVHLCGVGLVTRIMARLALVDVAKAAADVKLERPEGRPVIHAGAPLDPEPFRLGDRDRDPWINAVLFRHLANAVRLDTLGVAARKVRGATAEVCRRRGPGCHRRPLHQSSPA